MKLTINKQPYETEAQVTILEAAASLGIEIPTLCYNKYLKPYGGCRICLVEMAFSRAPEHTKLVPACSTYAEEGMLITTDSEAAVKGRNFIYALLLHRCPESEKLREFGRKFGFEVDYENPRGIIQEYLFRRAKKTEPETNCILCGLCVRVCAEVTERHALSYAERGIKRKVRSPFEKVAESCIGCGACAYVCPTKTITVEEAT